MPQACHHYCIEIYQRFKYGRVRQGVIFMLIHEKRLHGFSRESLICQHLWYVFEFCITQVLCGQSQPFINTSNYVLKTKSPHFWWFKSYTCCVLWMLAIAPPKKERHSKSYHTELNLETPDEGTPEYCRETGRGKRRRCWTKEDSTISVLCLIRKEFGCLILVLSDDQYSNW